MSASYFFCSSSSLFLKPSGSAFLNASISASFLESSLSSALIFSCFASALARSLPMSALFSSRIWSICSFSRPMASRVDRFMCSFQALRFFREGCVLCAPLVSRLRDGPGFEYKNKTLTHVFGEMWDHLLDKISGLSFKTDIRPCVRLTTCSSFKSMLYCSSMA